jgi:hypothetical protein
VRLHEPARYGRPFRRDRGAISPNPASSGPTRLWSSKILGSRSATSEADARLESKMRLSLLWGGIAGIVATPLFGLGALVFWSVMMAYLVAGPDGLAADPRPTIPAKRSITRWAGRGYAVGCAGLVLALLVPNLTYPGRPLHGVGWPSLALVSLGITVVAVGFTVAWAAWWGAIFNTHQLADKTWFHRLLWGGVAAAMTSPLFGFGALILAVVLIAYQHSAPDATAIHRLSHPGRMAASPV